MKRGRFTETQIVSILKEADAAVEVTEPDDCVEEGRMFMSLMISKSARNALPIIA